MQLPPVDVLLGWPTPNYIDPETRGPALLIVNSILIALTILVVIARLYTRIVIKRWFGIDDIFILFALLFTCGLTAVVLLANLRYGWDRHVWDIPFHMFVPAYKIAMTAKVVFTAAASFTRLSLHCFYYRLVTDSGKTWFKWAVHVNVAYTLGILISFPFVAIFFCTPIKNYWTIGAPADTCMDEGTATLICGIINCVADFLTTLTPIPLVMGLHMRLRERMAVAALFGMGLIVSAAGIVRTWFIYRSLFNNEYDQTWYAYPLWIAAAVEIDLGVICASAPVLKPLLAKIPFSLSQSLSGGISFKKSAHSSKTLTANASASHSSTNRKSTAPRNAPELANDKGNSYEMKHWADTEQDLERGSQEAILEEEEAPKTGMSRLWGKVRPKSNNGNMTTDTDMTITLTSEVELQVERMKQRPARYETHGDLHENHMPLPPLAPRSSGHDR